MIKKVNKTSVEYQCEGLFGASQQFCGATNKALISQIKIIDGNPPTLFLPACPSCTAIRVLYAQDPTTHPGYDQQSNHSVPAWDLIHGEAILAVLKKEPYSSVYKKHDPLGLTAKA